MAELGEVSKLAIILEEYDSEIEAAETAIKELKAKAEQIRCVDIPMAMHALGYAETTLTNGTKIKIQSVIYAKKPTEEALRWLDDNQFGGLIKNEVTVSFGRGGDEKARQLTFELKKKELDVDCIRTVHHSTLKAFIKEQLEDGKPIPMELFGASEVEEAKITHEKRSRVSLLEE